MESAITKTKKLLLKHVSDESQIYITGYDYLVVAGWVTLDEHLGINFKYDEVTRDANIRIEYNTTKFDIDAYIINGKYDYSKFCRVLEDTIISYRNYEKKKFLKMVLGL